MTVYQANPLQASNDVLLLHCQGLVYVVTAGHTIPNNSETPPQSHGPPMPRCCSPPQVLGMLGSVAGKRVVELGAGIGRFTGELARNAAHVLAVDFMENLIAQNRDDNAHCSNVEWRQADATQLAVSAAPSMHVSCHRITCSVWTCAVHTARIPSGLSDGMS